MSGDCNIYGGFKASELSPNITYWGDIRGDINSQTDLQNELSTKVNKETGKELSSNDFTNLFKTKLEKLNTVYEIPLLPENWVIEGDDVCTQTILISGISQADSVIADISLSTDQTTALIELDHWSKISKIAINDGSITAYYLGEIPQIALNVRLEI